MKSVKELLKELNEVDESILIEAKKGSAIDKSILETVCAYSNEPNLGGGYILLGVELLENTLFPEYEVTGISNSDKLQLDLSSQCASVFSQPIRPIIVPEKVGDHVVLKVFIDELPAAQKPVYFKKDGLPKGALRRIGSSDQRCTDDDLSVFYNHNETFDGSIVRDSNWEDVDENAISLYRKLRASVNENAEELDYSDRDLLYSLNCIKKEGKKVFLTVSGLHLFGTKMALRRLSPATRVDYIRVPGNEWVENPDERFITIDLRGSLLHSVTRAINAIVDDLPKGFVLAEGEIQAKSDIGLPSKVLREALVNALMHRSYKVNQPIQIIRYSNRIEIKNPGYSLKPEDSLGEPGSQMRNPFISAVFHETNLAETKGSGIRSMRKLMDRSGMIPPTFESKHSDNLFTVRLLLHHFLSEDDIIWLAKFKKLGLNEEQQKAIIFVREVGAIDNAAYRQLNGVDILKASTELRGLKKVDLLEAKGKGKSTYYIPGDMLQVALVIDGQEPVDTEKYNNQSAPVKDQSAPVKNQSAPPVPDTIQSALVNLGAKADKEKVKDIVIALCEWREISLIEIAKILGKTDKYVLREFVTPLRKEGKIAYTIPDMENHPNQAYTVT